MYLSVSQKVPTYINNNEIIIKILKGVWLKIYSHVFNSFYYILVMSRQENEHFQKKHTSLGFFCKTFIFL